MYKFLLFQVELLSRLNHENVVRYFNSWIETCTSLPSQRSDSDSDDESSITNNLVKHSQSHRLTANTTSNIDNSDSKDDSDDWINFAPDDDASDVVEFVNSRGEPIKNDDYSDDEESESAANGHQKKTSKEYQYMYIQMEFCEKNTLRETIDNNLSADRDRVWKLFREIVEGLSHIHQQGMIHR